MASMSGPAGSVLAVARGRGVTRPNATRTVAVDTPVRSAIARSDRPCPSSAAIRAASSPVSLTGPFGPVRSRTSPATPPRVKSWPHRHNVTPLTPNAAATSAAAATFVAASCTAASRRPRSSPAA